MHVYRNGHLRYTWPISTGRPGDDTPDGTYLTIDKGNLSWKQLVRGSALDMAVQAGPDGSRFISPSSVPPSTAAFPLQTAKPHSAAA